MYDSTLKDVKKTRRRRKGANLMGAATSFASIPEEEVVYVADTDEALPGKISGAKDEYEDIQNAVVRNVAERQLLGGSLNIKYIEKQSESIRYSTQTAAGGLEQDSNSGLDAYYQELVVLRDTLEAEDREANAPMIRCVEEQLRRRMQQLGADELKAARAEARAEGRLLEQHPYLEGVVRAGLPLSALGLSEDDEFVALAKERAVLAAAPGDNAEALAAKEQSLRARATELAAAVVRQEAALRERM
ncbi:calpain-like cysteine peptidase, partial [Trypanosoma conorhini]